MKFTATFTPRLLESLGTRETCESTLLGVFQRALWPGIPMENRDQSIRVEVSETCTLDIEIDLDSVQRDSEVVKYMLHEVLDARLKPEFQSDIEVSINDEL